MPARAWRRSRARNSSGVSRVASWKTTAPPGASSKTPYLGRGVWNGERILPESWVDFVRTPAPVTKGTGRQYGGWWWPVPDERADLAQDAYASSGSQGNYIIVVPSHDLVVVRRGLDTESWGPGPELSRWDLLAEVLKAFPRQEGARKTGAGGEGER
ncbi:MAG TPA: hypothetical protein VLH75_03985 [Longimicrobiales bacterium]|nr:hypothetical protein [Longimicrobiales bacterium]